MREDYLGQTGCHLGKGSIYSRLKCDLEQIDPYQVLRKINPFGIKVPSSGTVKAHGPKLELRICKLVVTVA